VTFDEIADELYGLPVDRFTEVRDRRAKEMTAAGHRQVADVVKKLRRPSRSASLANRLARVHPREIEEVLTLGRELRETQEQGRGDELRQLAVKRQRLVAHVLDLASQEAVETGHPFGSDTQRQLAETVEAALASPTAAAALQAGRLTEALRHVGFGEQAPPPRRPPRAVSRRDSSEAQSERRRRRKESEEAKSAHIEAKTALDVANQELTAARRRRDDAKQRLESAARRLREAEREGR
jgi:hypothetical protein